MNAQMTTNNKYNKYGLHLCSAFIQSTLQFGTSTCGQEEKGIKWIIKTHTNYRAKQSAVLVFPWLQE